jgi:Mrp family chromosome partitioning ATPase
VSRNYELMQQAALNLQSASMDEFARFLPRASQVKVGAKGVAPVGASPSLAHIASQEASRLVQSVFQSKGQERRTVVFGAISSGSGCSWISARIAEVLASCISGSVCLVEANFRTPGLPEVFGITNHYGLADALRQAHPIRQFVKPLKPANLSLVSCGSAPEAAINLLVSERMRARVDELRAEFDYVLIDAPPLGEYADTFSVGQLGDGLVLVLEANATRREAAALVADRLREMKVNILGAVLNKRTFPIPNSVYQRL